MRLTTVTGVVFCLMLAAARTATADPVGQVVYDRGGDIWIINADGTGERNLTNTPGSLERTPSISPDGAWVAYTNETNRTLNAMHISDGTVTSIYTSSYPFIIDTTWAPDGQSIMFRQGPYNHYDLWKINVDGSGLVNVTNDGMHNGQPSFSPDGTQIVYSRRDIPAYAYSVEVWRMNVDGTGKTKLTFGGSSGWSSENAMPNWSPDGTTILYSSGEYGKSIGNSMWPHDIWVMNPDGSGKTSLTTYSGWDYYPSWSPDGSGFAFLHDHDIWRRNFDGSDLTQLTFTGGRVLSIDWGPSAVPEAVTLLLVGVGLGAVAFGRRRHRLNAS